jgi:hypothetical protein
MIGVRGGSVLAIAGIVGVYCGTTGWSNRDAGLTPAASPSVAAGESLSSSPYASDSYLIWPGTPDATARRAESGLTITVTQASGGINVRVAVGGRSQGSRYYPGGARVYVVRTASGSQSLLVTDAEERIVA